MADSGQNPPFCEFLKFVIKFISYHVSNHLPDQLLVRQLVHQRGKGKNLCNLLTNSEMDAAHPVAKELHNVEMFYKGCLLQLQTMGVSRVSDRLHHLCHRGEYPSN